MQRRAGMFLVVAALLVSAPARGQGEPAVAPPTGAGADHAGGRPKPGYPLSFIDRPLALPAGMVEVEPSLSLMWGFLGDGAVTDLEIGATYGVGDGLDVGLELPLVLHTPEYDGLPPSTDYLWTDIKSFAVAVRYQMVDGQKIDVALDGDVHLLHGSDDTPIDFDVDPVMRIMLTPRLGLYTAHDFGQAGYLLSMWSGHDHHIVQAHTPWGYGFLELPLLIGYQVTPRLFCGAGTTLFSLEWEVYAEGGSPYRFRHSVLVADSVPFDALAVVAVSRSVDLSVAVDFPDVEKLPGLYSVVSGMSLRF